MTKKLTIDSTQTFKSIIYQFLIALKKCFEMQCDESIWIEKYGDVTNSNGEQIEVKDYQKNLTDLDHNVWKTLKNWLDDGFDISYYHSLILLTTQTISPTSKFVNWNSKNKDEKLKNLKSIASEYSKRTKKAKDTESLLSNVLSPDKNDKLLNILGKFIINSEAEDDESLYKELIETRTDGVLEEKKGNYLNSLVGYVIKPKVTSGGWEIKNKEFRQKITSLIETYTSTTKIFPKIEMSSVTDDVVEEHLSYLFVKKIEDIGYDEVKSEAISDFLFARRTITEELKSREILPKEYSNYESEVFKSFKRKHRNASIDANSTNHIKEAKKLYNNVTDEVAPSFYNFSDTPKSYRNGLLHEIANDEDNPTKLIWKLEVSDE